MSKFTKEMVDDYANKLLIGLTLDENKMVLDEFEVIDKNCDIVNSIPNISDVLPMTHCLDDFVCELRDDVIEESSSLEDILANSDQVIEREISVPKVVG